MLSVEGGECVACFGEGELEEPCGLAIGTDGRVFVSDCARDRICVFKERDSNGTTGGPGGSSRAPGGADSNGTAGGPSGSSRAPADAPAATTPSVTDPNGEGGKIKKAPEDVLAPYRFSYSIGGPGKKAGELADPRGITAHAGELWVADMGNHRVS